MSAHRRAKPRALWIWLHRWIGLVTALFLGVAALTGCLLCFATEIDEALNRDLFTGPVAARPMPVIAAIDRFQASHPALRVTGFPLEVAPDRRIPVKVEGAADYDQVFLDRATGAAIGNRSTGAAWDRRGAIPLLLEVHYTLLAGDIGRWAMGAVAAAWLVSNFIGVWLTWPLRRPFWHKWTPMWRISPAAALPRFLLELHRASGLWLLVPITVLALTSVALNFYGEAYAPLAKAVAGSPRPSLFDAPPPHPAGIDGKLGFTRAVAILERQAARLPGGWRPATALYFPSRGIYGVTLTDDGTLNYHGMGPMFVYVDGASGRLAEVDSPYGGNPGLVPIRLLYPLHSGQMAGPIGIAIVFILGLATFEMCVTGIYIWWRKRRVRAG